MSETNMKHGIILTLCLILQASALSAEFAGGTGEPNDPYQISTAEQLVSIGSDSTLMDKHFVLVTDIDLDPNLPGGQVFDGPVIGQSSSIPFEGALDGNGNRILNLTINTDGNNHSGLIGEVGSNGQVRNLGLLGVNISGFSAGSLAGTNKGSIRDCYATGMVSGRCDVGGLLGENQGSVTSCYSICEVTGDWFVGGLVGNSGEGQVSHCHATGSVTGDWRAGGLLGESMDTTILQCYATGTTSGNQDVGGLVGNILHCTITYCYAAGSVDGDHNVGGLVGDSWLSTIRWCYANGSVQGSERVGGLMGSPLCREEVYSCYFLKAEDGGGPDNGYGTVLTLSEITQPASFVGWDFYGNSADGLEDYWFMPPNSPPVFVWQTDITGLIDVPTLAGLTFNEAEIALTNAGFIVGTVKHDYDRAIPADHVVLNKPAGYAEAGTIVDILVSSGAYDWQDNPGQGSTEEPYQISSAGQLESLADHPGLWDKHFILIDDVNMAGRTYQTALIAVDANSAEGGFQGIPFTGSFDGNGFVISHLKIEPDVPSDSGFIQTYLGLFGKVGPEGNIHRFQLENVKIAADLTGTMWHVGPIGALATENEGTISDCSVTGNIIGGQHTHGAGALVGINSGEIHSSYSANGMVVGDSDVGGLVGRNDEGTIANCYTTISVEAPRDVGGLVGDNQEGTLYCCYANGLVTAERDRDVGGLVGDSWPDEGTVINCFWDMETTSQLRSEGGTGLTTTEMMDASIYSLNGWAGNSSWVIDDGKDYPRLEWEGTVGTPIPEPVIDWLEGAGTAEDPYRISSVEQFRKIATASVLFNKHFLLTTDINLEGIEWRPIGICPGTEFDGVFDGNDYVISNLNITDPNGPQYMGMALFGYTANESVIKRLILKNIMIVGDDDSDNVGGLVGNNRGTVKDCRVEATLTGNRCGGLAGENAGLILYCSSTCQISADYGLERVGCLVGENSNGSVFACQTSGSIRCGDNSEYIGGAIGSNYWDATVIACSADVNVTCGDKSERVGGLVGFNWGTTIAESYASGTLTVGEQSKCLGGFVGENWSNVVDCYASGTIVTVDETIDAGGLVGGLGTSGKVTGSYFLSPTAGGGPDNGIGTELTDSQMRQQVSFVGWDFARSMEDGTTDFWLIPDGGGYPVLTMFDGYELPFIAGSGTIDDPYLIEASEQLGFAARNPDACYRLVADLNLTGINWTTAVVPLLYGHFDGNGHTIRNLSITGGSYMGLFVTTSAQTTIVDLGVIDANISGPDTSEYVAVLVAFNEGTIARCAVAGAVAGGERIGGLTGENDGRITDCYATCRVTGRSRTGGLVGENNGPITTSYVNGEVLCASDSWVIGALVGNNYRGSLVNCLWEKRDDMVINSDLCQGLTTEQMMDGEILGLNGWAENPNWVIDNGNDYPHLVWEGTPGEPIPVPTIDWLAGEGTPEDPYRIETVEQLKLIGTANVLWDKHFALTADLDCDGVQFDRIGVCPGTSFSGSFDGAYYHISNLTLGSSTPRQRNLGLFGYINSEGSLSRIIMENVQVLWGAFSDPVATLAAVNHGSIVCCGAAGSMDCDETCWGIGGLVGENNGTLESCYANVTVRGGDESGKMGGLVADNNGHINNSYALGSVRAGFDVYWLGGLAGITRGPLIHCYAAGHVDRKSAVINTYPEMGGLVGKEFSRSVIVSCYFLGRNNSIGTYLSGEEMKMQESFIGWDFDNVWVISEGGYPRLQWEIEN